jgi:hypothetical protein
MGQMNPYTAQLLRRVRALPLTEARDLVAHLQYAEEWVFFDLANRRCAASEAVTGEIRCLGREFSSAIQVRKQPESWSVSYQGNLVGTTDTLDAAVDMAETELELAGYIIPWRKA